MDDDNVLLLQGFSDFAKECGLELFPDPHGERYVYQLDLKCAGKKCECTELIDDLWNALARSNGREELCVPVC